MKITAPSLLALLSSSQANIFTSYTLTGTDLPESSAGSFGIQCTVAEVHGLSPPGMHPLHKKYSCSIDDDDSAILFFDNDASPLLGHDFEPGHTKMKISSSAISSNGTISVEQAMRPGTALISNSHERRLSTRQAGTKTVLVVRIVDKFGNKPVQNETRLYDDWFNDSNNLKERYNDCSNGKLQLVPAIGAGITHGVLTVEVHSNEYGGDLSSMTWQECGDIGARGASGINRDFVAYICPDSVNFEGAAAWGAMPGSATWYSSWSSSFPIVQVHEIGHNLGHPHSGRDGDAYDDGTCHMGNQGSWSDYGNKFCFNGVKTWRNGWHSGYHQLLDPIFSTYDGNLYGINAVNDDKITEGVDKVVIKASSNSVDNDIYVMFNRRAGPNSEVPEFGDQVIVHMHDKSSINNPSVIVAELSAEQTYTHSWGNVGTLIITACSIDTSLSPGVARVLVYATGTNTLSCSSTPNDPAPTDTNPSPSAPVKTPTLTPVTSPSTFAPFASCDNNANFTFELNNGNIQDCAWFTKQPEKSVRRKERYCGRDYVAAACLLACDNCSETCEDRKTFSFELNNGNTQDCAWFTKRAGKTARRKERYCGRDYIAAACQLSCDSCSDACEDEGTFSFELIWRENRIRGCDWLTKNSQKTATRLAKYCDRDYGGTIVKNACPKSCGSCAALTSMGRGYHHL